MNDKNSLELQDIAGGAVQELFSYNMQKVLANIYDKNTSYKKTRKVVIELKFTPSDDSREVISADIDVKPVLAPVEGVKTKFMLDKDGDKFVAAEFGNRMKGQITFSDLENNRVEVNADGEIIQEDDSKPESANEKVTPLFRAK